MRRLRTKNQFKLMVLMYSYFTMHSMLFSVKFSVFLRPFCISFNVFFSICAGNDGSSTPRRSVSSHRHMKEMLQKEDQGILSKCGSIEDLDGQSPLRRTALHIHYP